MKAKLKAPKGFRKLRLNEILREGDRRYYAIYGGFEDFKTRNAGDRVKDHAHESPHIYIRKVA